MYYDISLVFVFNYEFQTYQKHIKTPILKMNHNGTRSTKHCEIKAFLNNLNVILWYFNDSVKLLHTNKMIQICLTNAFVYCGFPITCLW